jgi:hypothetical protein
MEQKMKLCMVSVQLTALYGFGESVPLAIAASLLHNGLTKVGLPKGAWYHIPRAFNVIALVSTTAGYGIAVSIFNEIGDDHLVENAHTKIGIIVFLIMLIHVFLASIKPSAPPTVSDQDAK